MLKFNPLVKEIASREGGKVEVNIAQISEIVKIMLEEMARVPASEAMALIEKHASVQHHNGPNREKESQ